MIRKLQFLKTAVLSAFLLGGANLAWGDTDAKNLIGKLSETTSFYSDTDSHISSFSDFSATNGTVTLNLNTKESEFRIGVTLPSDYEMDNTDTYFVFEATNLSTSSSKAKMDLCQVKVNDNTYEYVYKEGNGCRFTKITLASSVLYVVSPMSDKNPTKLSGTTTDMQSLFEANSKVKLHSVRFIFDASSNGAAVAVKRMGFYTMSEIMNMYPTNSNNKYIKWRQAYSQYLWIESDGEDGSKSNFRINNKGTELLTLDKAKFILSTLGNPSCNMDLRNLYWGSYKEDVLGNFTNTSKILLTDGDQGKVPTMNTNVFVAGAKYYAYKDGSISVSNKQDGGGSTTYYNFTRNFKKDYNSCVLPFDIETSELPTGLSAYVFSSATDKGAVTFAKADATISAGTPFIVKATEGGLYLIPAASDPNQIATLNNYYATAASNNIQFVGSFVDDKVPDGDYASSTNYGISTDGKKMLKMKADTKTTYYRAFIADKRPETSRALSISFDDGDGTTVIVSPEAVDGLTTKSVYYDLQGRRVANPSKGLYIVNGKKVIIK